MSDQAINVQDTFAPNKLNVGRVSTLSTFKLTDVGSIPPDWEVQRLGQLGRVVRGSSPRPAGDPRFFNGEYVPWLTVAALTSLADSCLHVSATLGHLTEEGAKYSRVLLPNTLIIANSGATLGIAKILDLKSCANDGIAALVDQRSGDKEFLCYWINTQTDRLREVIATGNGQPNLNTSLIREISVPFPPPAEQRAIAEALSDVDGLIGALEALIAKKRAIKQATVQQLLTGKTRLLGFSGKWETKRLEDFASVRNHKVLPSNVSPETQCVELEHIGQGDGRLLTRSTARDSMSVKYSFQPGDVLFGRLRPYLRKFWLADCDGICTTEIWPLTVDPRQAVSGFLHILVQTDRFIDTASISYGTHMPRADWGVMRAFEVRLPRVEEQQAIAIVLSDMDAEIDALERRRDKARQIKQGMMQQLLTGRIRLVKPGVATSEKAKAQTGARQANVHFMRSVLAAEIIDQLHEQPTFGHVKFEKMMFLVEHLCEVDTGSTYHRKAAGPYDNRALRSIDSQLRAQQWFDARKEGKRYQYVPMQKRGGHRRYFDRYFSGIGETFDRILGAFRTLDTERCEIVATLFSAWSDLLRDRETVSDELIVHEVLNNWHEAKRRIPEDRWLKALGWMRSQGFVPKGAT